MNLKTLTSLLHPAPRNRMCFIHIPKTAGKSVTTALHCAFFNPFRPSSHFRFLLNTMASRDAAEMFTREVADFANELLAYSLFVEKNRLVTGHFYLPTVVRERFAEEWVFATILRHPVDRWISGYFYNRNKPNRGSVTCSLDEYLESRGGRQEGHIYTAAFCGTGKRMTEPDMGLSEKAVQNLRNLDLLGFVDDLPKFQAEFSRIFGTPIVIPWLNRNPTERSRYAVTVDQRKKIEELCEADIWVYEQLRRDSGGKEKR